jgi:hypothetical protein
VAALFIVAGIDYFASMRDSIENGVVIPASQNRALHPSNAKLVVASAKARSRSA